MPHPLDHTVVKSALLLCTSNKLNFDLHVPTHNTSRLFMSAPYLLLFLAGVVNINVESSYMNLDSADSSQGN